MATGIHNVYVSPDGKWVVAGLNGRDEGSIQVIDPTIDEVVETITLVDDDGEAHTVRPMAFVAADDGSVDTSTRDAFWADDSRYEESE